MLKIWHDFKCVASILPFFLCIFNFCEINYIHKCIYFGICNWIYIMYIWKPGYVCVEQTGYGVMLDFMIEIYREMKNWCCRIPLQGIRLPHYWRPELGWCWFDNFSSKEKAMIRQWIITRCYSQKPLGNDLEVQVVVEH